MSVFASEFLGTATLVLLGNALVSSVHLGKSHGQGAGWLAVAIGWGLALWASTWVAASSGAHLNPAITIALAAAGAVPAQTLGTHIPAQLAGAALGALLASLVFLPHWRAGAAPERLLGCFCTVPAVRAPLSNMLAQAVAMCAIVVCIHAVVAHPWTPPPALAAVPGGDPSEAGVFSHSESWRAEWWQFSGGLGLLLAAVMLSIGGAVGGALNPARDLSSRAVHALLPIPGKGQSDWPFALVAVAGPLAGALAGVLLAKVAGLR